MHASGNVLKKRDSERYDLLVKKKGVWWDEQWPISQGRQCKRGKGSNQ